jgi:hypothetical protein
MRAPMRVSRITCALALATLAPVFLAAAAPVAAAAKHPRQRHARRPHHGRRKRAGRRRTFAIRGGSITLTFTATAWSKLNRSSTGNGLSSSTSATPIAPATASGTSFTFPITGGSLNRVSGRGSLTASGGIEISSTGTSSFLTTSTSGSAANPLVALGATSTVTVTSENFTPPTVTLLGLALAGVRPYAKGNELLISDIPATVTTAAQQLFGIAGSFNVGEEIGTLTIRADA